MAVGGENTYPFRGIAQDIAFILGNSDKIFYILNPDLDEKIDSLCYKFEKVRDSEGTVFLSADGRSGYISDFFGERLANFGFNVYMTKRSVENPQVLLRNELTKEDIRDYSLGLPISGSGQTTRTVDNAKFLKDAGVKLVIFTSYTDTPLTELVELEKDIFKIPGGLRKGELWQTEYYQLNSSTVPEEFGYTRNEIEAVIEALNRARDAFYLGGFSEILTLVMTEMLTTKIGNYFGITQKYAADRHPRDDREI
jgi:hypothetical protein